MVNVKVSFLSLLVDIIGKEEITLSVNENLKVKEILENLKLPLGKAFEEKIFDTEGKLSKYIILGLNGKDIRSFKGLDTIIKEGDEISFLPAIAGG